MVNFRGGGDAKTRRDLAFVMATANLGQEKGSTPTTMKFGVDSRNPTILRLREDVPLAETKMGFESRTKKPE